MADWRPSSARRDSSAGTRGYAHARARRPVHDAVAASRSSRCTRRPTCRRTPTSAIGLPGEFPFTRGVYPTMYRGRLWTMRQFAGLRHGGGDQRALPLPARPRADRAVDGVRHAVADGPRLRPPALARRGRPRGRGDRHARRHGDAVRAASTSARSRVSMTINAPAAIMLAFYVVAAEEQGVPARPARRARSRPTSSRSTSPRRSGASRSTRRCGCWAT